MIKTGGPGGSGIAIVLRDGLEISTIVNPNTTLFSIQEKNISTLFLGILEVSITQPRT
jgi:hypothetical protein